VLRQEYIISAEINILLNTIN